jgi:hypothetical protein
MVIFGLKFTAGSYVARLCFPSILARFGLEWGERGMIFLPCGLRLPIYLLQPKASTATATIPDWARRTFLIGRKKMDFMNFTITRYSSGAQLYY